MTTRIANVTTIKRDITAWELARLMFLQIEFKEESLAAMLPSDRLLVERHSRERMPHD